MRWAIGQALSGTGIVALLVAGCVGWAGCGRPAGVIFPPPEKPLVWPAPPETPRITYVGRLATSADLKPAVSMAQALGEALFGKESIKSMLTPYALCTDGHNRLFVADSNAQVVHVFDLKSRRYEQWPKEENRDTPKNRKKGRKVMHFSQPVGIAWDPAGRLYVADSMGGCLYLFDKEGRFVAEVGRADLQRPVGLAFDAPRQRLYVADTAAHRIAIFSPDGQFQAVFGQRGSALGQFNYPTNVAVDRQGRLYVSDSLNWRVQQFGPDFKAIRQIGAQGDMPGYFTLPKGLAIDQQDHLYVIDARFEVIEVFDSDGRVLLDFGQEGKEAGEFWLPTGLFIDQNNRIWVADSENRRVQVFDFLPEVKP